MTGFPRRRSPGGRILRFGLVAGVAALALGGVVMALWNAILPATLHVGPLSYWQGVGLLVLCRLLVGGRSGGRGGRPGPRSGEWPRLSPDERRQFRQRWRNHRSGPAPERPAER